MRIGTRLLSHWQHRGAAPRLDVNVGWLVFRAVPADFLLAIFSRLGWRWNTPPIHPITLTNTIFCSRSLIRTGCWGIRVSDFASVRHEEQAGAAGRGAGDGSRCRASADWRALAEIGSGALENMPLAPGLEAVMAFAAIVMYAKACRTIVCEPLRHDGFRGAVGGADLDSASTRHSLRNRKM
jgi:hypothetical protein